MSEENSKSIKFSLVVDQASTAQFKNAIGQMTKTLTEFTRAIAAASSQMGSLLSGGHVGGPKSASAVMATPGVPGIPSGATGSAGPGMGAPASGGTLGAVFLKNAQAFQGMATSSKNSMKVMTDGIKEAVRNSEQNLSKLNQELKRVSQAYYKAAASSKNFSSAKLELQQQAAEIQSDIGKESGNLAKLNNVGGGGGFGAKFGKFMGGKFAGAAMSEGVGAAGVAGIVGAIIGGLALAQRGVGAVSTAVKDYRMGDFNAAANHGSLMGNKAMALWNNDYRNLAAEYLLSKDSGLRSQMANATKDSTFNNTIYGGAGVLGALKKIVTLDGSGIGDLRYTQENIENSKLGDREAMIQKVIQSDPMAFMKIQQFYDSAGGRVSAGRRMGYMYGRNVRGDVTNPLGDLDANLTGRGYSLDAGVAAMSSIAGFGGERAGHANMMRVLGAQSRGFGGAAQLVGTAAMGAGENYIQHVFGAMGQGDMQAVGGLGIGLLGRNAANGQGEFDQSALLHAAMNSGLYTGGGGDMLATRQIMGGLGSMDRRYGGGVDGYGKGMMIRAVQMANTGASAQGRDYMATQMSYDKMIAIAKRVTPVSRAEAAMGITPEGIKRVLINKSMDSINRIHNPDQNTLEGRVAQSIKDSGLSPIQWAVDHKGYSSGAALAGLTAINMATPGVTEDAATGEAAIMLGMSGKLRGMRRSGGLGDAARGTAEEQANEANAKKAKELADFNAQNQQLLGALAQSQKKAIDIATTSSTNLAETANDLNDSFKELTKVIDKLVLTQTGNPVKHAVHTAGAKGGAGNKENGGKK